MDILNMLVHVGNIKRWNHILTDCAVVVQMKSGQQLRLISGEV